MSIVRDIGKIVRVTAKGTRGVARGVRATASGTTRASRWVGRNVGVVRQRGGVGNVGLMRLLDLHAISCAGDTLVTIGLAGTIFAAPAGEARGRVALYLLITMVPPFALLAPVVGPVLDRFRHGRRYALAATMLGRAVLGLADRGQHLRVRAVPGGVRGAGPVPGRTAWPDEALPRLLPRGLGLSQAGARASVYGTIAGAIVAPLGVAAFWFGPQWPLRVASLIFLAGMVVALRLPAKADSRPARGAAEALPDPVATPGGERSQGPLRGAGRRRARRGGHDAGALRVPAGVLRVRDPGANGSPGRCWSSRSARAASSPSSAVGWRSARSSPPRSASGLTIKYPVRLQAFGAGRWPCSRCGRPSG